MIKYRRATTDASGLHHMRGAVTRIVAGSLTGQGLVLVSYPFLTRLYHPVDFGVLVVFTSVTSMLGVLSTASLDGAVLIPRTDEQAAAVAWAALTSVTIVSSCTALVGWIFGPALAELLGAPELATFWWLIALTVAVQGTYLVLSEWMVRVRSYGALGRRNLMQGIGQVTTQVGLGIAGARPVGLLLGSALGRLAGSGGMLGSQGLFRQRPPHPRDIVLAIRRFRRFPLVSSWSKLLNTAGLQVPFLVISAAYGDARAGLLGLAVRIIGGPSGVLGQAVYQAFNGESSERLRRTQGGLAAFTRLSVRRLFLLAAGPAVLIVAFGPITFGWVFGPEWTESGRFAQLLAIVYLAEFAVTPISNLLRMLERQGTQLAWDAGRLLLTAGGPALCALVGASMTMAVTSLAAAHVAGYAAMYVLSIRAAATSDLSRKVAGAP
jgi:O-antigen/teichoic acid export membrane protein